MNPHSNFESPGWLQESRKKVGKIPTSCWFPIIRTLTVGLRISLSQPIPGWHRVADYNRRFEITSTPETTCKYYSGSCDIANVGRRTPTITQCLVWLKQRMGSRPKSACAVAWNSNGARSGPRTGMKLNTAAIDVVKINEAHYLYSL